MNLLNERSRAKNEIKHMPETPMPENLMNSVLAKIYDIIVNGDGTTVPKSEDNFFSWCSPGIPFDESDFEFLQNGLTGVIKPEALVTTDAEGRTVPRELRDWHKISVTS